MQQVIEASIACARTAAQETGALVALDIGPIGELLAPAGTLPFEDACAQFAEMVRAGAAAGADLVFLETMTDLYELKAAILAAKENCDLPVFTSMSFEARGRTFTGCTVESYGITAAGLGADAVGINCSLGPKEILPFAQRLCRVVPAGMPVFVKPNAGLPNLDGSYDITPAEFAAEMAAYLPTGISMLGAGHIMVQRYGDILDGKRTWQKELAQSNVKPTLKDAVAGDITAAMPYRAMTNIIEFIKMLDMVVPGFAANETLLYSPELKFYSNKVKMDADLDTNIKGLHCLGDSSGWTRGLMMASVMGVLMGRKLAEKEGC